MRSLVRRSTLFLLGVCGLLLLLEIVLQVLPVSTATMRGYDRDPDVRTYPPHHRWQVATGWDLRNVQVLHSNNWGFAADQEFVPDARAVALIGDSFIEASMLPQAERPAAQLEAVLQRRRPVYALGNPGTALLDYAQRIRLASRQFDIRDFVLLLEAGDARQSLCGSGNIDAHCLDPRSLQRRIERQPPPGSLKRWLRHSALAQYVVGQIKLRPEQVLKAMFTRATPDAAAGAAGEKKVGAAPTAAEIAARQRMVRAVVDAFFSDAAPYLNEKRGRLIVVVDGGREGPLPQQDLLTHERTALIEALRAGGAIVHDLMPVFAAHRRSSARSLTVGPYDGHFNAIGVRLAMTQAAASLND